MSTLTIAKEEPAKKFDSGGGGASGLSQLLTSSQGKEADGQDSPRGGSGAGGGAFGAGPKLDGSAADDADDSEELRFGVDIPFTCKIYFPSYKPPPEPAQTPASPQPAGGAAAAVASAAAAAAQAVSPVKGGGGSGGDAKAPGPTAAATAASPAPRPRDRLAAEPGMLVVHITEDAKTERLLSVVMGACFAPAGTKGLAPGTPVATDAQLKALVAGAALCPCDERGQRDDECPPLDAHRFVHQFGVHHFLLKPLRAAPLPVQQQIATLKPLPAASSSGGAAWVGPQPKRGRLLDPNARMFVAAETGKLGVLRRLVEHAFADVHATGIDNWTALHFASRAGHLPVVNYLLKQGVNIDAPTKSRWTPLHMACDKGKYDVAEVLLTCGAEPNVRDTSNHTPAHYAALKNATDLVELLAEFQGVNA